MLFIFSPLVRKKMNSMKPKGRGKQNPATARLPWAFPEEDSKNRCKHCKVMDWCESRYKKPCEISGAVINRRRQTQSTKNTRTWSKKIHSKNRRKHWKPSLSSIRIPMRYARIFIFLRRMQSIDNNFSFFCFL